MTTISCFRHSIDGGLQSDWTFLFGNDDVSDTSKGSRAGVVRIVRRPPEKGATLAVRMRHDQFSCHVTSGRKVRQVHVTTARSKRQFLVIEQPPRKPPSRHLLHWLGLGFRVIELLFRVGVIIELGLGLLGLGARVSVWGYGWVIKSRLSVIVTDIRVRWRLLC